MRNLRAITIWFADEGRPPIASEAYIIGPFGMLFPCCILPVIATPSIGVSVDGVDGCELDGKKGSCCSIVSQTEKYTSMDQPKHMLQ